MEGNIARPQVVVSKSVSKDKDLGGKQPHKCPLFRMIFLNVFRIVLFGVISGIVFLSVKEYTIYQLHTD